MDGTLTQGLVRNLRLTQFVPLAVVMVIVMLIIPLPPFVLDILIAFNIAAALTMLLAAMYAEKPSTSQRFSFSCSSQPCSDSVGTSASPVKYS